MSESKISSGNKIGVIGCGKLGLCFCLAAESVGYDVLAVDVFPTYVDALNQKTLKSAEPQVMDMLKASKNFRCTTEMKEAVAHSDVLFVLVATPTTGGPRQYDHSTVSKILVELNDMKVKNKHIVISATVMPGYIASIARGLICDTENCHISYNPAFVAQGDIMKGYMTGGFFGLVLIGSANDAIRDFLKELYTQLAKKGNAKPHLAVMSAESAEIAKLSSNCFRTVKIAFTNMIADIADRTPGADKYEICDALSHDISIGDKCMRPGFGFGGPCYPRDNVALGVYASSVGINANIAHASDKCNSEHADYQVQQLLAENKDEYVFEQVAYKPNTEVPMIDNSQKLVVARRLVAAGKKVVIKDRAAVILECKKEYGNVFEYQVHEWRAEASLAESQKHY